MQKIIITLLLLFVGSMSLKGQTCQWAEKIAGTDDSSVRSTAVDANGNVYVAGMFAFSTLNFNNGITLTNSGGNDIFIAKYNSNGLCQWAEKIAGTDLDYPVKIVVDGSGNIYVAGGFLSATLNFNNGITLTNSSDIDIFITKYNSSGQCKWAVKIYGTSDDYANITVDGSGNVYVVGIMAYGFPINFNNGITLTNSGGNDIFIAKYSSNGLYQWAEKIAGTGDDYAFNITIDDSSNIYVAGKFKSDTLTFNNGKTLINNSYGYDFITKYDSNGKCQWAEMTPGEYITVDGSGNIYVAGDLFSDTLIFNNGISLTISGMKDCYIAKYNSSGKCQWAEKIAGTGAVSAQSITNDSRENVYLTGTYQLSSINFNNGVTLTISGGMDPFVTKYNSSGQCQWAEKIAGTYHDDAYSISVDGSDNVYIAGNFYSDTLTFNNGITLTNSNYSINHQLKNSDGFIAKYTQNPESVSSAIDLSLTINPNPASDYIEIKFDNDILSEATNLFKIYNNFGECVMTVETKNISSLQHIEISYLPNGIYFIQIGEYSKSFVVVR